MAIERLKKDKEDAVKMMQLKEDVIRSASVIVFLFLRFSTYLD
jgi:hypothetical protein